MGCPTIQLSKHTGPNNIYCNIIHRVIIQWPDNLICTGPEIDLNVCVHKHILKGFFKLNKECKPTF